MSDGEHDATLDRRRASGPRTGQRSAAPPPSARGAAPWERLSEPPVDHSLHRWQAEPLVPTPAEHPVEQERTDAGEAGCHAGGALTVADL
ncbi:MAG: LytR family transcriptional regulator, partial [Mycobacterium sp.]|nr:LytR family transcriptional regulator [Mycobacterium sp.]